MKNQTLETLLRNLAQGNKEEVINTIRRQAAEEYRKNKTSVWATTLEGFASSIERRSGVDAKMLTLLNPSGKMHASMEAFDERVPTQSLADIILPETLSINVQSFLNEHKERARLAEHNLKPQCRVLLTGEPGTGKTMLATILAKETGKPFYLLRMGKLMDSHLGCTIRNIENSFAAIAQTDGVFLFDEFDALATSRDGHTDINEMRRALNALLICFEHHQGPSIIVAATNRPDAMDRAFRRRFDSVWKLPEPNEDGRHKIIRATLTRYNFASDPTIVGSLAAKLAKLSFDECEDITRKLIVQAILRGKPTIELAHFEELQRFDIG